MLRGGTTSFVGKQLTLPVGRVGRVIGSKSSRFKKFNSSFEKYRIYQKSVSLFSFELTILTLRTLRTFTIFSFQLSVSLFPTPYALYPDQAKLGQAVVLFE